MRNLLVPLALVAALVLATAPAEAQIDARMLRNPDVSATQISFVYGGDIWVVPKEGGVAQQLSSPPGAESFPRFSPDGSRIAFSGNYDGNLDLYVVPASGGVAERVTHHPAEDRLVDWTPDGTELIFATDMTSGTGRFNQLYRVSPDGGLPERMPPAYGEFAALADDGRTLALQTKSREFRTWKRYRGGKAPDIWLLDLETLKAELATDDPANDSQPMWHGRTLFFLSDRDENMRANIWAKDLDSGEVRQVTRFTDFDVHFPAIGPDDIVFEAGGELYLLDLATESTREVPVKVVTDGSTLRPRMESPAELIAGAGISPSGARAVFEARGEMFTVPAEHGPVRNLSRTSGEAERFPAWSPDGRWIAYWSDATGEYELFVRAADGSGDPRRLTELGPGFRYRLFWSPDSEKIVFIDHTQTVRMIDVESGKLGEVDRLLWSATHPSLRAFEVSWSPDSRWFAYSKGTDKRNSAIMLFDTSSSELHQVTSAFYDDLDPVFGADGDYLFLLTNRSYDPIYADYDGTWVYANATRLAALPLRADVASPLAPRNDVEEVEEDEEKTDEGESEKAGENDEENGNGEDEEESDVEAVEIDLDGIESRLVLLPPAAGNYSDLAAVSGKLLYVHHPRAGAPDDASSDLMMWDLEERESKTVLAGVEGYDLAAGGDKLLVTDGNRWGIVGVAPDQKIEDALRVGEMRMTVNPRAEWRQVFTDAWRYERDFFYDPDMHGVDWEAMRDRYGALIDQAVTRWDVHYVIGELIAELNVSHSYRFGGDVERAPRRGVGLLGVDWELADGGYRIARIVRPASWEHEVRSPLDAPGVDIAEGDWVLAVNGVRLDPDSDPWAAFDGLAGETVVLTVNDRPTVEGSREIVVETLASEARLRNLDWIESNRRRVEEASDGRIGYVFVPDTGINGQNELVRQFYAQATAEGLIVDERFNGGGQWPDRFIELLNRPRTGYIGVRTGPDPWLSPMSRTGPTVMLVNGWAGSGGDAFPYLFRRADLGPIIGTRTWGGLVGISGVHSLIDGGVVTVPNLALYTPESEWMLEGHGLEPDIEVVDDPGVMARGTDPQLERAIDEVLQDLERDPVTTPPPPPYEDRTAAGRRR